ncbi:DUF862-domain-containing protein [Backusella circina FSU 941]|nr:DUF862-domain-containing protein [Backusella circina FSU 941]
MLELFKNLFIKVKSDPEQDKRKVVLNVYDMLQPGFITNVGFALGVGIYHSGVEIGDQEYCFGGHDYEHVTGVFMVKPTVGPQGLLFKQSIHMGFTDLTQQQVEKILQDISKTYVGTSYNLLTRNCNHFSEELCKKLTGKAIPGWVNRAARLGTMFPCVIPTEWVEPPDINEQSSQQQQQQEARSPSSSCSSNTPLQPKTTKKRHSSTPSSRRPSGSADSILLVRTPVIQDDEIDRKSPVKEPDTHRPDVIRSATQLSITAPVEI